MSPETPSGQPSPSVPPMPPPMPQFTPAPQYTPPPPPPPRNGVPLVLMIVFGGCGAFLLLVGIMAAVLFPVFNQARIKARTSMRGMSECMLNERQIGLAMTQYVQDYDEKYPASKDWMQKIEPYTRNKNVFRCPLVSPNGTKPDKFGYAFNSELSGTTLQKIEVPFMTVLAFDSKNLSQSASGSKDTADYRHLRRANFLYVDGHAQAIRSKQSRVDTQKEDTQDE